MIRAWHVHGIIYVIENDWALFAVCTGCFCQTRQYVQKIIKPGIALIDLWYVCVVFIVDIFLDQHEFY